MKRIYLYILCSILFNSCNYSAFPVYIENRKLDFVPIEILEPAEMTFPENIRILSLLKSENPVNSLNIKIIAGDSVNEVNHMVDEYINNSLFDVIAGYLYWSPRFDFTDIHTTSSSPRELSWAAFDSLSAEFQTDAFLTLESYVAYYNYYTTDEYTVEYGEFLKKAYLSVKINSTWSLIDIINQKRHIIPVEHKDNYEGGLGSSAVLAAHTLPSLREIIEYDATVVAEKCGKSVTPFWQDSQRGIYAKGERDFRRAKREIMKENDWGAASEIWKNYNNSEHPVLKKHSRFNMVVATEVLGSIKEAYDMALAYNQKYNDPHMIDYIKHLQKRLLNKQLLDRQFHIEE